MRSREGRNRNRCAGNRRRRSFWVKTAGFFGLKPAVNGLKVLIIKI
jgi:hypothetical protein